MRNKIDLLDKRVIKSYSNIRENLNEFRRELRDRKLDSEEDKTEISILPRVISQKEAGHLRDISYDIVETSFKALNEFLKNPDMINYSPMNNFIKNLPLNQDKFSGVGRLDFLKQGEEYKLIENNFVYIGSWRYLIETNQIWKELFKKVFSDVRSDSPIDFSVKRHKELGLEKVILLSEDDINGAPNFVKKELSPLDVEIVSKKDYDKMLIEPNKKIVYQGKKFDSLYPRCLSGSEGFNGEFKEQSGLIKRMLESNTFVFDNWKTILIEDKDLSFLTDINQNIKDYLPKLLNVEQAKELNDLSNYVLKLKDLHSGRGVIISPNSLDGVPDNSVIQERIFPNKYLVLTNYGNEGYAVYDTGVHIAYTFDIKKNKLEKFDVAGILSRFSLNPDGIVNMCQGGGMIPTFVDYE